MKLKIENIKTTAIIGGVDNLLPFKLLPALKEYLRVRVDGYHHTQAYKMRRWDGYRYFITDGGVFATGFLPYVVQHCKELGVEITEVQDCRTDIPKWELKDTSVGDWTMFDFQQDLANKIDNYVDVAGQKIYFPRGIMDAATNAGKTSVVAGLYKNLRLPDRPIRAIMLLHSKDLYKQQVAFFQKVLGYCGEVNDKKYSPNDFTVAMFQSMLNKAKESINVQKYLGSIDVLFVDETHKAGSDNYSKLLQMIPSPVRVLVSGTPLDNSNKVNNMIIVGISGTKLGKIDNKALIEGGFSLKPIVHVFMNKPPKGKKLFTYDEELNDIVQFNLEKNRTIAEECAKRRGQQILIVYNDIAHGEAIFDFLKESPSGFTDMELVHGKDKERSEKIERFKSGETKILISSMILKEGMNIPNIECLILTMGGKSVITVKQLIGRALRRNGDKETVDIIDFYDYGKYVSVHSKARLKIYKTEEFEVIKHYEAKEEKYTPTLW